MIGIGPLITIPLVIRAARAGRWRWSAGSPARSSRSATAWSGPNSDPATRVSGGTYVYLREIFGAQRWGRLLAFLFNWQFFLSASLVISTGYIGFANYAGYLFPAWPARIRVHARMAARRRRATLLAAVPPHHGDRLARHRSGVRWPSERCLLVAHCRLRARRLSPRVRFERAGALRMGLPRRTSAARCTSRSTTMWDTPNRLCGRRSRYIRAARFRWRSCSPIAHRVRAVRVLADRRARRRSVAVAGGAARRAGAAASAVRGIHRGRERMGNVARACDHGAHPDYRIRLGFRRAARNFARAVRRRARRRVSSGIRAAASAPEVFRTSRCCSWARSRWWRPFSISVS